MDQSRETAAIAMERRCLRSNIPYQAVEFYFSKLKQRASIRSIALADNDGLLLAGIGRAKELELLALWGALEPAQQLRYAGDVAAICHNDICTAERLRVNAATEFSVTRIAPARSAEPVGADRNGDCLSADDLVAIETDLRRILAPLAHAVQ